MHSIQDIPILVGAYPLHYIKKLRKLPYMLAAPADPDLFMPDILVGCTL